MKNLATGVVIAAALALALSPVTIAGIAAWKIVLAAFGAVLVVTAGRGSTSGPAVP
jgi:membrane-bound ClpP family serine protease